MVRASEQLFLVLGWNPTCTYFSASVFNFLFECYWHASLFDSVGLNKPDIASVVLNTALWFWYNKVVVVVVFSPCVNIIKKNVFVLSRYPQHCQVPNHLSQAIMSCQVAVASTQTLSWMCQSVLKQILWPLTFHLQVDHMQPWQRLRSM